MNTVSGARERRARTSSETFRDAANQNREGSDRSCMFFSNAVPHCRVRLCNGCFKLWKIIDCPPFWPQRRSHQGLKEADSMSEYGILERAGYGRAERKRIKLKRRHHSESQTLYIVVYEEGMLCFNDASPV